MKIRYAMLLGAAALTIPLTAFAYTGQQLEKTVKISSVRAKAIALKKEAGKILDVELEKENGGTGIRYTFTVDVNGVKREVGVDANTGAILEDIVEGKNPD